MDAVISEVAPDAKAWGDAYCKAHPPTPHFLIAPGNSADQAIQTIVLAAQAAPDGIVIFNVGHGSAGTTGSTLEGTVDLAPAHKLPLGGANASNVFVNVFYDVNMSGSPAGMSDKEYDLQNNPQAPRLVNWNKYRRIATAFDQTDVRKVVFLTCNVGKSSDFLKKIANDWDVIIEAYLRRMVIDPQRNGRTRMHLEGDSPGFGTNIPASETELPLATETNSVRVGPPLP
jgi:hypothetical protein